MSLEEVTEFWEIVGVHNLKFIDLLDAISYAKSINKFVVIKKADVEICGIFGVDSVVNGLCPNGEVYTWSKAHRIGRVRKNR